MSGKIWTPILIAFLELGVLAGQRRAVSAPYEYGFLGGDFFPDEDSSFSTWNDIHFACHFFDAQELQLAIGEISDGNRVLIDLGRAWQSRTPSCDLDGPWGDVGLFIARVQPLLTTLAAHQGRLLALWIFDEPDGRHGGPSDADLAAAVDYLHQTVPGVPAFVNWFQPEHNTRLANVDWHATTKGADSSVLSGLGKPMFLWWFNNEEDPHPVLISQRWQNMVSHFYRTTPPPIAALGWCCDSVDNFDDFSTDNSIELTAVLANLGQLRRDTGTVFRAPYARRPDGTWYLFRREADGTLSYTDLTLYPLYRPLPVGGASPFYPAVSLEPRTSGTWIRLLRVAGDGRLSVAWIAPDHTWVNWSALAGRTDAKPDVLRFRAVTWQAIRNPDGTMSVLRDGIDGDWLNLGGATTSAPFFKIVAGNLRVAAFGSDGQVYSREWNGSGWVPWMVEP
jgi:hypothetical protein